MAATPTSITTTPTSTTAATTTTTHKPTIKRGSKPYTYHVESKTRVGIFYVVDCHRLSCTCPAGRARRGCWHLRISLALHDWRLRQQAQHNAAPTSTAALAEVAA